MLLAVDIGNTNIKFGVFDGEDIVARFSVPTTSSVNELVSSFTGPIDNAIICSVVPNTTDRLAGVLRRKIGKEPFVVTNEVDFGLKIDYEPLSAVGTDRLVNSFAAAEKYATPCIVCSFGTATTIDVVCGERVLLGGVIAPGMKIMAKALDLNTAQLPEVEIEKPAKVVQNTTAGAIRSGIAYGYFGLVDGLLTAIKNEIGGNPRVIATGGFAAMIAENTGQIDVVDNDMTLDGLRRLHERNTTR